MEESTGSMFIIYLLGIILGGIATIVSLIFGVISLANSKRNPSIIWGASFLVSITILVISIFSMVQLFVVKAKDKIKNMKEWADEQAYNDNGFSSKMAKENWLDTLDYYVRENVRASVPEYFYKKNQHIELNGDGTVTAPFIYPYSVKFSPDNYGVADIINDVKDSLFVRNVLSMAFDENFVIAKLDNKGSADLIKNGSPEIEFVLFDMRTGQYMSYKTEDELFKFADRIGYVGKYKMEALSVNYAAWIEEMEFGQYE